MSIFLEAIGSFGFGLGEIGDECGHGWCRRCHQCFPGATLHRDLEHIKKDVKRIGSKKKVDPELTLEIAEIIQFSAKVAHPLQFHVTWEDTLRRLRDPEDWNQDSAVCVCVCVCVCDVVKVDYSSELAS